MKSAFIYRKGQLSVAMLFFAAITVVLISGFVFLGNTFLQLSVRSLNRARAFSIAEAGVEYYRWHLAHSPTDYWDGRGSTSTGPYTHSYYNKEGDQIGTFSLLITPPPPGSTVVTVRSTASIEADPSIQKIIEVKLAIPSLAKYAIAANDVMRFGTGTEVFGEIYSNQGIRFDGLAHNLVQSAVSSYDDPDHGGGAEFGVHTHLDPTDPQPPAAVPSRPDVFMAGRAFPVPALDFAGITQNLSAIKTAAQSSGFYVSSSGVLGWDLVFATSGRFTVYKVTGLTAAPNGCTNTSNQPGWGTWSINTETLFTSGTIPQNGNMFFEDNLWVRGQVLNKRVTVASGKFPVNVSTYTNITVNQNLLYSSYNGSDTIALIAQNNINVGLFSADVLRIDAALIAQNGRIGRYYYSPPNLQTYSAKCGDTVYREQITLYGMMGSDLRYGFGYTDSSGYQKRILIYDPSLLYAPPPSYPLTTNQYQPISWNEIQ
jgi:hypothetical protein